MMATKQSAQQRRDSIEELDALVRKVGLVPGAGAASAARRIDRQVSRLEHRVAELQVRGPTSRQAAEQLLAKIRQLGRQRREILDAPFALPADQLGAHARLRSALYAELLHVRTDAAKDLVAERWLQQRAAQLIRARRNRLQDIARNLRVAVSYTLRARALVRKHRSGNEDVEPFEVSRWLGMAALAQREAHQALRQLGQGWPEAAAAARQRDWTRMPFATLRTTIEGQGSLAGIDAEELGALGLWLSELAEQIGRLPIEAPSRV